MNVCECVCASVWGADEGSSVPPPTTVGPPPHTPHREHRMETIGVSDLLSLPGGPGGRAIWPGVWMAPSSSPLGGRLAPSCVPTSVSRCLLPGPLWRASGRPLQAQWGSSWSPCRRPRPKEGGKQRVPCVHSPVFISTGPES